MAAFKSFTLHFNSISKRLITECKISKNVGDVAARNEDIIDCRALWDTGANVSAISIDIVQQLQLTPFKHEIVYHAGGERIAGVYKIDLALPSGDVIRSLDVIDGKLNDCNMLIGMDIITNGDFAITNRNGKTVFSFQTPSSHLYNFVEQLKHGSTTNPKKKKK